MKGEAERLVLAGIVRSFVEWEAVKSLHYFQMEDLYQDDPIALPKGKVVRVTFEYVSEKEIASDYERAVTEKWVRVVEVGKRKSDEQPQDAG